MIIKVKKARNWKKYGADRYKKAVSDIILNGRTEEVRERS